MNSKQLFLNERNMCLANILIINYITIVSQEFESSKLIETINNHEKLYNIMKGNKILRAAFCHNSCNQIKLLPRVIHKINGKFSF